MGVFACRVGARGDADSEDAEPVRVIGRDEGFGAGGVREVTECAIEDFECGGGGGGGYEAECDEGLV